MSLIEEALRRLQDPLLPPAQTGSEKPRAAARQEPVAHSWPTTPSAGAPRPPARSTNAIVAVTLTVVALTALLVSGGTRWMRHMVGRTRGTAPSAVSPSAPSSPVSVSEGSASQSASPAHGPARRAAAEDPFVLSGVVEGVGTPYAVINGSIAQVGDHVAGATLVDIGQGSVTLRLADGTDVVRSLPH